MYGCHESVLLHQHYHSMMLFAQLSMQSSFCELFRVFRLPMPLATRCQISVSCAHLDYALLNALHPEVTEISLSCVCRPSNTA